MARKAADQGKCLACGDKATRRGLCAPCYMAAYRDVRNKKTTWAKLIKAGLAKEKGAGWQPSKFAKAAAKRLISKSTK